MKPVTAVLSLAFLAAACSKPTELASEANAKYDTRDAVVAPPPVGEEVDVAPVAPLPGSPEAEAMPVEAQLAPAPGTAIDGSEAAPAPPVDQLPPPLVIPPDVPAPEAETIETFTDPVPAPPTAPAPTVPPADTAPTQAPS